ncbi:MAG: hypothetical protein IT422_23120, partial [Pirellulaceae bacterium]|nr:hypothetical protein [Pirellulaceae bacterium]
NDLAKPWRDANRLESKRLLAQRLRDAIAAGLTRLPPVVRRDPRNRLEDQKTFEQPINYREQLESKRKGLKKKTAEDVQREADEGETAAKGTERAAELQRDRTPPSLPPTAADDTDMQGAAVGSPLTPLVQSPYAQPPKSQREIINDLAKGLNIPIRYGRLLTKKFGGYFRKVPNLIGAKRANDIPVVSHEVGHKLDDLFKLSSDRSIAPELESLGDPTVLGSRSSWTPSKAIKYKRSEGVAEFVRLWLTEPNQVKTVAPNTYRVFEEILNANKDLGDVLRQAQEDIRLWRTADPQARLRSHISTGTNPNQTRYTLSQLTRDLVNDLHFLQLAVEHAKRAKPDLLPSQDPNLLARNLRGSFGAAENFIHNGVVDGRTMKTALGTSLEDALRPVAGRLNDFQDWIVAKAAQELHRQNKETGLVPSDVDYTVNKFSGDAVFVKAFDDVKKWQDSVLDYLVAKGLVSPQSAAAMRKMNQDFVPLHRVFEIGAGESPSQDSAGVGRGLNVGSPGSLRRRRGSFRQIVAPIETMVRNAYTLITAAEKQEINLAVAGLADIPDMGRWVERVSGPQQAVRVGIEKIREQLEDSGADLSNVPDDTLLLFFQQGTRAPVGENTIAVRRGDKTEFYRLNSDLFNTLHALDLEDAGKIVRILSSPAQLLRAGVTLDPEFSLFNVIRDTFGAAVLSKYGALPFETTIRGVIAMLGDKQAVADWMAAGGKSSVEAAFFDQEKLQKYISTKISKDLTAAERALIVIKSPLTVLRWLSSTAEEATRIGESQIAFRKLVAAGMPAAEARRLAAFEARDRQDFAKGGAKTKSLRAIAAFWNAALQGNLKVVESLRERPIRTTLQGMAYITLPTMLLLAMNWDDDDYWARPQWERDAFWLVPYRKDAAGHTRFVRLPKPFLLGVIFGVLPERIAQSWKEKSPKAAAKFPATLLKEGVFQAFPNPQFATVVLESMWGEQGYDMFRERPIVPDSLADLPPELQWTEQTSELAKKIGATFGVSPLKIDHFIEQTTGGLGKLATGRRKIGQRLVTTPLSVSNQATEDFYEIRDELNEQASAAKMTGQGIEPPMRPAFEKAAAKMSELRKKARATSDDTEKLQLMDQAYQIAKQTIEEYRKNPQPKSGLIERRRKLGKALRGRPRPGPGYAERATENARKREQAMREIGELDKAILAQ